MVWEVTVMKRSKVKPRQEQHWPSRIKEQMQEQKQDCKGSPTDSIG
jgi:hypothetical protein